MDTRTGTIYETREAALAKGVPENRLVTGTREALAYVAKKILTKNQAKAARRKARGK